MLGTSKNFFKQWLAGVQELHFQGLHCLRSKAQKENKHSLFATQSHHIGTGHQDNQQTPSSKMIIATLLTPLQCPLPEVQNHTAHLAWPQGKILSRRAIKYKHTIQPNYFLIDFFFLIYQSLYILFFCFFWTFRMFLPWSQWTIESMLCNCVSQYTLIMVCFFVAKNINLFCNVYILNVWKFARISLTLPLPEKWSAYF